MSVDPGTLVHGFPFDPTYGCDAAALAAIRPPEAVPGFDAFWRETFAANAAIDPNATITEAPDPHPTHTVRFVAFDHLGGIRSGGWLLEPRDGPAVRGLVIGHGYGGRGDCSTGFLPRDAAAILPCAPGFDRSARADLPNVSDRHVVHGITAKETYLIRACVAGLWSAATVLLQRHPGIGSRLYYFGESFGGGLGALALPWDTRFAAACLVVPTFGHHPWRLRCPCVGSGEAGRRWHAEHPEVVDVLAYYDAAVAATRIRIPVVGVPAYFDPAVPPPGQWAVINGLAGEVDLCPVTAGHFENPTALADYRRQREALERRFL